MKSRKTSPTEGLVAVVHHRLVRFSSFRGWLACGFWRNLIWIGPLMLLTGLLTCGILIILRRVWGIV